jgi:ATP-binding cassette subfamily F protein 3
VAELEKSEKEISAQLADAAIFADPSKSTPLVKAHREITHELEELYERWEREQEELAKAEAEIA